MAYLPLSTANLPDPVIDPAQGASPEDYFSPLLYTGDGTSSQEVNGLTFQPDFVWIKNRTTAVGHVLHDAVRGNNGSKYYYLSTNSTAAETVSADDDALFSLDSDGFTVGYTNGTAFNASGNAYASWNWKANGSGTSIAAGSIDGTNPTIASTVSANTTSGFSIVSYAGNGTAGATIGHGLNQAPEFFIIRSRDGASARSWIIYDAVNGATKYLRFDTNASTTSSAVFNNTEPTATVFSVDGLGGYVGTNGSTENYIAYCFHSVPQYSKVFSYTGNGSADGTFVFCDFKPAFVMIKASSVSGERWVMHDTDRREYNADFGVLFADSSLAENTTSTYNIDILSNGFKVRTSHESHNQSGQTYIGIAFAETPFKYSTAR